MRSLALVLCVLLCPSAYGQRTFLSGRTVNNWTVAARNKIPVVRNLSGCAWHRQRDTVLLLDDTAKVIEVDRDGNWLRQLSLTNPPTSRIDLEGISIVSYGVDGEDDVISLVHEGLNATATMPAVPPYVMTLSLPVGAWPASINLGENTTLFPLAFTGTESEGHAWDESRLLWHSARADMQMGEVDLFGVATAKPIPWKQDGVWLTRYQLTDMTYNQTLSDYPIWQIGCRFLTERDPDSGRELSRIDFGPLLRYTSDEIKDWRWEGISFDDDGNCFWVREGAQSAYAGAPNTYNFVRLDLIGG